MQPQPASAPGLGYDRTRRLVLVVGLAALAGTAAVAYVRRVETPEVVAVLLFLPIFLALLVADVRGGAVAAVAASVVYAAVRWPAIDAVGAGRFAGLLVSRTLAFVAFGVLGGWAVRQLERSLDKLDLYDQIDDETGLYNARFLVQDTDLELARATRYRSIFSVAAIEVPAAALDALGRRSRAALLRDLGRLLRESVRTVDRAVHARDSWERFAVVLPETGPEGAAVFASRLAAQVGALLRTRGVAIDDPAPVSLTIPGDEERLQALQQVFAAIDRVERPAAAG